MSADDIAQKLLLGGAYKIFFDEVREHIPRFGVLIDPEVPLDAETFRDLSARAHTIKGGAGFFKLTGILQAAGKLEKLLGGGITELPLAAREDASRLVRDLEAHLEAMPKPQ